MPQSQVQPALATRSVSRMVEQYTMPVPGSFASVAVGRQPCQTLRWRQDRQGRQQSQTVPAEWPAHCLELGPELRDDIGNDPVVGRCGAAQHRYLWR